VGKGPFIIAQSGEVTRCPIGRAKPEAATHWQRFSPLKM
jgi:hypothetical protein